MIVIAITNGIKFAVSGDLPRKEAAILRHTLTKEEEFLHKRFKQEKCKFRLKH